MIERLAIFGATGDLTARYLLPGLAALQAAGQLSGRFQLTAAGREEWDNGDFRHWAAAQLDRHGGRFPAAARQAVVSASSYHRADAADLPSVGALKDMLQNHLLQLLCPVAMEPPISLGERDLRDRKLDALRSVRPLTDSDVVRRTRRALSGRPDR